MNKKKQIDDIIIETITKNDLKYVLDLYSLPDIDNGKSLQIDKAKEIFEIMSTYPSYKIYVAKLNDIIVGTFSLIIMDNIIHFGRSTGLVESVVVHEKYRSLGIGKKMMEFAIQRCKESNCYKMSLSSNMTRERAHSFYERLGFKKHGYSFMIEIK